MPCCMCGAWETRPLWRSLEPGCIPPPHWNHWTIDQESSTVRYTICSVCTAVDELSQRAQNLSCSAAIVQNKKWQNKIQPTEEDQIILKDLQELKEKLFELLVWVQHRTTSVSMRAAIAPCRRP